MAARLSATLEDYLGVILSLEQDKRFARVSDIAASLGVAKSAVTAALQRLANEELVTYRPYEPVTLTREGQAKARDIRLRHRILLDFLEDVLLVDRERSEAVACEMEHGIDSQTLEKIVCFLAFVAARSTDGVPWLDEFRQFMAGGADGRTCHECMQAYIKRVKRDLAGT